ncbi:PREDICTED: putative SWI/SNF-related matrix-associated actin-dependent regulator of chromatin subfamily A member 3-like 2 isoform X3 [Populus euphratica]|uniref:SWI/SNF-related matrix-associated actin-dependent regulator of chromatin subfamily A member 3-like 2 isoform X3 n=1 Tax=Populus euphratica TaxID=75702 RepID=A0AAJ6TB19_POPEU|nr:PREDICTED: putative SWI/SNF-related matrix-associated actin-dependent regulator of chromatin subfamily A member 3-like 2 isoform X3 [Populus euphratica]
MSMAYSNSSTEGRIKAIVFSQWISMSDLVEISLNQFCIQYRRLDGTLTLSSRNRVVKDFNTDPKVTVMLMSLKAGNLGLNMVAACHEILLDLWCNPTTEDQAVDRAHRIAQEERRKMVASAFGEDQSGGSATRLTVEDLKYLFMF